MSAQGAERTVGRYEIVREIGRGGMATVYLARQTDLDRYVALKELAAFYSSDPAFAERFVQESRVTGSLSHHNIVTVHDFFEDGGTPYIAMEYVERGSLRPLVGRLAPPQLTGVLEGLLAGLAHAEARGVVHRDLKPENVMVTAEGGVKIADFGIAKALNRVGKGRFLTATGTTVGTPAYMAPEQAMGREVGAPTDLYSLGIIAYEMLSGAVPFADTDAPMALLLRHVNESIPPLTDVAPDVDPGLARWVQRLLEKDPVDRFQRATDAWHELEEIAITMLGPLWRREARLVAVPAEVKTPDPLTPAPFHEESVLDSPEDAGFQTFVPGRARAEPARARLEAEREAEPEPEAEADPEVEPVVVAGAKPEPEPHPALEAQPAPPPEPESAHPSLHDEAAVEPDLEPPPEAFRTYRPRRIVPPAPVEDEQVAAEEPEDEVVPPPPEPVAPAAPVRVALAAPPVVDDGILTVPPTSRPRTTTFQWPVPQRGGALRRLRSRWLLAAVLAAVAVSVGVVAFGRSDSQDEGAAANPAVKPTPEPVAEVELSEAERLALTVAGESLYVAGPDGRVLRLLRNDLKLADAVPDPAGPRSLVVSGGTIYAADGATLLRLRPRDLVPVAAAEAPATLLAGGGGRRIVAAWAEGDGGSVCLVSALQLNPCVRLPFAPAGIAVVSGGQVVAAAAGGKELALARISGGELELGRSVNLGTRAAGALATFRGKVYAAVERGIAIVNPTAGKVEATIALPATPSSLWIVPFNGRLFAAVPASDQVAMIDTASPDGAPRLTKVGRRPTAVTGALTSAGGTVVYAANAGDGSISRLEALTGALVDSVQVGSLGGEAPARLIAQTVSFARGNLTVTATLRLESGKLTQGALVADDIRISDGRAVIDLWQAGAVPRFGRKEGQGVTVRIQAAPARLRVTLTAPSGAFTRLTAQVAPGGDAIVFTLTEPPPDPVQPELPPDPVHPQPPDPPDPPPDKKGCGKPICIG